MLLTLKRVALDPKPGTEYVFLGRSYRVLDNDGTMCGVERTDEGVFKGYVCRRFVWAVKAEIAGDMKTLCMVPEAEPTKKKLTIRRSR